MSFSRTIAQVRGAVLAAAAIAGCSASVDHAEPGRTTPGAGQSIRNGIPGGDDAVLFGVVGITNGTLSFGTGTLLSSNWVLTAGHVADKILGRAGQMRVRLGDKDDPSAQERGVAAVYLHPSHVVGSTTTLGGSDVDVALLRLSSAFTGNIFLRAISTAATTTLANTSVSCMGYGLVQDANTSGGILTFADGLPVGSISGNSFRVNQHTDPDFGSQVPLRGDSGGSCTNANEDIVGVISSGDIAVPATFATLIAAAAFRSWAIGTMNDCSATVSGSDTFCSAACPCPYGYGDCETGQCSSGNVCDSNVGPAFAAKPETDICVKTACASGEFRSSTYCSASCPCGHGGGDCDTSSECQDGLTCDSDVGPGFNMTPSTDVCVPHACALFVLGASNYCSSSCPCGNGGGDCDSSADCMPGLVCRNDIGPAFDMSAATDVCVPSACTTAELYSATFCSPACPCGHGGGDCDSDQDCMPGLTCGTDNGPEFGQSATTDICVR